MELGPNGPIERQRLPWGPKLDRRQRMEVARLGAAAERRAYGMLAEQDDGTSYQELLEISRDPLVWGVVLGRTLANIELKMAASPRIADWARRSGADENAAETHRAWLLAQPLALRPIRD